jgi:hypothetical protein
VTPEQRFWVKVDFGVGQDCWPWLGTKTQNGYGRFWNDGRMVLAHRFSMQLAGIDIPEGKQADHICNNRACVNPAHLRAVTPSENTKRGALPNKLKTECKRGHPLTPENTYLNPRGSRHCRICDRMHRLKYRPLVGSRLAPDEGQTP